jgi:hypothetical protein
VIGFILSMAAVGLNVTGDATVMVKRPRLSRDCFDDGIFSRGLSLLINH